MAADFDSSDILGSTMPFGKERAAKTASFSYFTKMCVIGAATLLCLLLLQHGRVAFLRWKERHYKLSMRRKHGIPDHDHRPFNVAYAAARRAKEDMRRKQIEPNASRTVSTDAALQAGSRPSRPNVPDVINTQRSIMSPNNVDLLRNRAANQPHIDSSIVSGNSDVKGRIISSAHSSGYQRQNSSFDVGTVEDNQISDSYVEAPAVEKSSFRNSRERDEISTRDHRESRESSAGRVSTRSKRVAESGEDGDLESNEGRHDEKRRRKVSASHPMDVDENPSDNDMELDHVSDMKVSHRGKKRDRAEAGSIFGGDDELFMDEQDGERAHRHRRRRHRKSSLLIRGQKRGREIDSVESDESDDHRKSRRRTTPQPSDSVTSEESDVSMDESPVSKDPLCKGRRIGDEWESHGVQFKVGPNGERLRKVLVKEDRRKFNMPVDSAHPDRGVSVTVIVERWYTEAAYQLAKERRELAWQDESKSPTEPQTPGDDSFYRDGNGKDLLWMSDSARGSPVSKRGPSAQSVAASLGLRISSLVPTQQIVPGRRVSSLYNSAAMPPPEGSPKLRSSKSYSRWEKQEMEAEAMNRIRRKIEEEKAKKAAKEAASALSAAPKANSPVVMTPSPLAAVKPAEAPSQRDGSLLPTTSLSANAPATEPKEKASIPSASPFSFPPPTASSVKATDSTTDAGKSKPNLGPSSSTSNASSFSFAPPASNAGPPSAPSKSNDMTVPSGSTIPNFFGIKGAANSPTPAAVPVTQAPSPAISAPAVKSPFSFGAPSATGPSMGSSQQGSDQSNGPSLLTRLSQPVQPSTSVPTSDASKASSSPFAKPSENASAGVPVNPSSTTANNTGSDGAAAKPKFNFGFPGKSDSTPLTTNGAAPSGGSGSVASPFSFGSAKDKPAPTDAAKPAAVPSPFGAPAAKSSFGGFGSGGSANPFAPKPATPSAGGSIFGPAAPTASNGAEASKPVFSFKPAGPSTAKQSDSTPTAMNSAGADASGEKPKSAFFAPPAGGSVFGKPTSENATPASPFSFGNSTSASQAPSTTKSSFSFGSSSTSTLANDTNKPASPFGGAGSTTSAFGAATNTQPATGGFGFSFGASTNNTTTPAPSVFGGAPPSAGTNPAVAPSQNTSAFGSKTTTPSAFGFGAPSTNTGSFTFGSSNAGQSSNKTS